MAIANNAKPPYARSFPLTFRLVLVVVHCLHGLTNADEALPYSLNIVFSSRIHHQMGGGCRVSINYNGRLL